MKLKAGDWVVHRRLSNYGVGEIMGEYPDPDGNRRLHFAVYFADKPDHKMYVFPAVELKLDPLHQLANL